MACSPGRSQAALSEQVRWNRMVQGGDVPIILSPAYDHPLLPTTTAEIPDPQYTRSAQQWFNQLPDDTARAIIAVRKSMVREQALNMAALNAPAPTRRSMAEPSSGMVPTTAFLQHPTSSGQPAAHQQQQQRLHAQGQRQQQQWGQEQPPGTPVLSGRPPPLEQQHLQRHALSHQQKELVQQHQQQQQQQQQQPQHHWQQRPAAEQFGLGADTQQSVGQGTHAHSHASGSQQQQQQQQQPAGHQGRHTQQPQGPRGGAPTGAGMFAGTAAAAHSQGHQHAVNPQAVPSSFGLAADTRSMNPEDGDSMPSASPGLADYVLTADAGDQHAGSFSAPSVQHQHTGQHTSGGLPTSTALPQPSKPLPTLASPAHGSYSSAGGASAPTMHSPPSSGITGAAVSNAMHGLPSAHAASTTSHRAPSPLSQPPAGGLPLTPRGGDFGLAKEMQQAAKASAPAPVAPAVAKPRPLALAKPVLLQSPASKAAAILAAAPQPVTAGAKSGALPAAATGGSSFAFKAAIGNNKALPSSYGAMEDVDSDGDEAPILSRQAVKSAAAAAGPSSSAAPPKILTTTSSSSAVR
ncbi:MAG: hypothetical protein WDW36_003133 [Sanguina aurantia]